jgi:hypothetical protein
MKMKVRVMRETARETDVRQTVITIWSFLLT